MNIENSRRTLVMLGAIACLLLALSGTTGISTAADSVLYVKPSATSTLCSDWANACTLQAALGAAGAGDEIWVAEGTHKPTDGTDRTVTFQLKSGVALYGGFAGTETNRDDRDWTLHETILSGDIGTVGDKWDNTYHVVTGSGTDGTAVLDGFTVTGGNASGNVWPHNRGGGMYNYSSEPTLTNVTFSGNHAVGGGGMQNVYSNPTLINVTFSGNHADYGGGMYNVHKDPTLINVTFSGNHAVLGGGMSNYSSDPTLINATFTGNDADSRGGGMYNSASSLTLINVTFSGNSAYYGGGMFNLEYSSLTLTNVTFSGNSAEYSGGGVYNEDDSSPTLTNVTFSGNSAEYSGGGVYNDYSGPTLINSILWGNTAPDGAQIYNDGSSAATISYSLVEDSGGSGPGWDANLGTDGGGNIDADPKFVDADGPDDVAGTLDDNLRLLLTSPAIDAGDKTAVPADTLDLDGDGDTAEPLPFDLDGNPRIFNGTVDIGAYEQQGVSIDIKPGSDPNSLTCYNEKEVITVAILTSPDFGAMTVDHTTVTFEGASEIHVDKKSGEPRRHEEDVDRDGDIDLAFHFRLGDTDLACDSTEGTLTGETFDGQAIVGIDAVRMIGHP